MSLFKRTPFYIKISIDKVEITNLSTSETITKISPERFSTSRVVIANFNILEVLIRDTLKQIIVKSFFPRQLRILIQQVEEVEGGLTEIEKRALRDLAEQAGGFYVVIVTHFRKLSDREAISALNTTNWVVE